MFAVAQPSRSREMTLQAFPMKRIRVTDEKRAESFHNFTLIWIAAEVFIECQ